MPRVRSPLRCTAGQASTEYLGVLGLVALLVGVAVAACAALAPGTANAVLAQVRHGLCVVAGEERCAEPERQACVTGFGRQTDHASVNVALLRVDEDHVVLRERLSDGRMRLTLIDGGAAGLEVGLGARGAVTVNGRRLGVGGQLRAAVLGMAGHGRVFHVASRAPADRLVEALTLSFAERVDPARAVPHLLGLGEDGPEPDERFTEVGAHGELRGTDGVRVLSVQGRALARGALGARRDRRTGATTLYLRLEGDGSALLGAALGGEGTGRLTGGALVALTLDRDDRPVEASLLTGGAAQAADELPPLVAARLGVPARSGEHRRWELDARVGLDDPAVRGALAAWRADPFDGAAARALGAVFADRAQLDTRVFSVDRDEDGVELAAAAGARVGFGISRTVESGRLVAAAIRPAGGVWEQRGDCVRSA